MRNEIRRYTASVSISAMMLSLTSTPYAQPIGTRPEEVLADIGNLRATGNIAPRPKYWCEVANPVPVSVWPHGDYNILDVQRLLKQVGSFVEKECPHATRLMVFGFDAQGKEAWRRVGITKAAAWHLEVEGEDLVHASGKDFSAAIKSDTNALRAKLTTRAEAGDARAQYALGLLLQFSAHDSQRRFTPQYAAAAQWFQKAADQRQPDAMYALASLYRNGLGVPMNDRMAGQLLDSAAKLGHARAMVDLADWYLADGLLLNHLAIPLYQRAADLGHPEGFRGLGVAYHSGPNSNGVGLSKDYARAMQLYRKAAAGGSCSAVMHIGGLYFNGDGVPQNGLEAAKWFAQAASCPAASESTRAKAAAYAKKALGGRLPPPEVRLDVNVPTRAIVLAGLAALLALYLLSPDSPRTVSPGSTLNFPEPMKPICIPSGLLTDMEEAVQSLFSGGAC